MAYQIRHRSKMTVDERFWDKVDKTDPDGCWRWLGFLSSKGYGAFSERRVTTPAHRWAYERVVGPIPAGLQVDHLCRKPSCVNPDHLEPVTNRENLRRSMAVRTSVNAAKTHCKNGHEFTPENTSWTRRRDGRKRRHCLACKRLWYRNKHRGQEIAA